MEPKHSEKVHETETQEARCCGGAAAEPCCDSSTDPGRQAIDASMSADEIRQVVRQKYGELARADDRSCCGTSLVENPEDLGYSADQSQSIPEGANLGLGCGNPLAHAQLQAGETVLDLGSGAGIDAFLAAQEVGPTGHVIGVDMTPEMLERARANAKKTGITNVEFRLGEIEHLPVANDSVDLIISNCVVNLSPDKAQVFREAFRVLRPGGRLVVSDLVLLRPLPADVKTSVSAYVGCIAGASLRDEYLQRVREAGFSRVEVVEEKRYAGCDTGDNASFGDALDAVVSAKVRAWKRG
jgi:SAM-dependent methyltransferase